MLINETGGVIKISSKLTEADSAMEAEVKALEWASSVASSDNWSHFIWSSDALSVVKKACLSRELGGWDAKYAILNARNNLCNKAWKLLWNDRTPNSIADRMSKLSFRLNLYFLFDNSNIISMPFELVEIGSKIICRAMLDCNPKLFMCYTF